MTSYPFEILCRPGFACLQVAVPVGHAVFFDPTTLISLSPDLKCRRSARGGLARFLSGGRILVCEAKAVDQPGEISLAAAYWGDIGHIYLTGNEVVYLRPEAYLASSTGIRIESHPARRAPKPLRFCCQGVGDLWFSAFGGIVKLDLNRDESFCADLRHAVALSGAQWPGAAAGELARPVPSAGLAGRFCTFSGASQLWLQSQHLGGWRGWLEPFRRLKKNARSANREAHEL